MKFPVKKGIASAFQHLFVMGLLLLGAHSAWGRKLNANSPECLIKNVQKFSTADPHVADSCKKHLVQVALRMKVDAHGLVKDAKLTRSSGCDAVDKDLKRRAKLLQFQDRPGCPDVTADIDFKLNLDH